MMGDSTPLSDTAVLSFYHSSKQVLFSKLAKGSDSMDKDRAFDQNSGRAGPKKNCYFNESSQRHFNEEAEKSGETGPKKGRNFNKNSQRHPNEKAENLNRTSADQWTDAKKHPEEQALCVLNDKLTNLWIY